MHCPKRDFASCAFRCTGSEGKGEGSDVTHAGSSEQQYLQRNNLFEVKNNVNSISSVCQ